MLSQKNKYAIKALLYLAQLPKGERAKTADISKAAHIPKKFLELILLELKRAQMVASKQGVQGGYYLLKKPEEISLIDVFRLIDGPIALLPCASLKFYEPCEDCQQEEACRLRWALIEIRNQTLAILEKISLKTMLDQKTEELIL
ncbi:MAG: Rrf2 family transcriptional regulator [Cytophagales bacterium]|nr:MAG: Rrf2 family transcriptional regulator [Cytophagales bacterium]